MKKIAVLFISIIFASSLFAQAPRSKVKNLRFHDLKPVHWGFTFGVNTMDFNIHKNASFMDTTNTLYGIENRLQPGFHLGPIFNVRLGHFWDLRFLVNLSFGQRNLTYYTLGSSSDTANSPYTSTLMKLPSTFIEAPVLFKYKAARLGNSRAYMLFGGNVRYDLNARKEPNLADGPKIQLEMIDAYAEVGFGIDWYLPYFKLSTELKYSHGFMDVMKKDATIYTSSIDKLNSKMLLLSFHFEG